MPDEYTLTADSLIADDDEDVLGAIERDARRYNKAFTEAQEAAGE